MTSFLGRTWAKVDRTYPITVTLPNGDDADDRTRSTTMAARWAEADPAVAVLALADPWREGQPAVEWVLSRSLLVSAHLPAFIGKPIGMGDAQITYSGPTTTIHFNSVNGCCAISMRGEVLKDFLRATAEILPLGDAREGEIYAAMIERELAELFGQQS